MNSNTWLDSFAFELTARGLSPTQRSEVIVETETYLDQSGTDPIEEFGLPADYAASVASAIVPPSNDDSNQPIVIDVHCVTKSYRSTQIFSDLSMTVKRGQIVALIGPNGAGKTTLLKVIAGLLTPNSGTVQTNGRIGYCSQEQALNPYLRASEHAQLIGAGLQMPKAEAVREAKRLAAHLDWDLPPKTLISELSGGTAQKLHLLLAMLGRPDVLLLDEPYQGFDNKSARRFWELLWDWRDAGGAAVISSHSEDILVRADTIVEMVCT